MEEDNILIGLWIDGENLDALYGWMCYKCVCVVYNIINMRVCMQICIILCVYCMYAYVCSWQSILQWRTSIKTTCKRLKVQHNANYELNVALTGVKNTTAFKKLINKLVLCSWLSNGALEIWIFSMTTCIVIIRFCVQKLADLVGWSAWNGDRIESGSTQFRRRHSSTLLRWFPV